MGISPVPRVVLSALVLNLVAGCGLDTVPQGTSRDTLSSPRNPQIVGLDGLGPRLRYDEPIVRSGGDEPLTVTVPIRPSSTRDIPIQYRFTFLATDGKPVGPEMDWQYKVLLGRGWVYLSGTSLDAEATDWHLDIRAAK